MDRQSPDSSSLDTKRKSMVDLTDSEVSLHTIRFILILTIGHNISFILQDEDHVTTTSSKPGPVKTFDDLFGSSASATNGSSGKKDSVVFNKDSDDESDSGGGAGVNVEELIRASDDDDGEAIGIDW